MCISAAVSAGIACAKSLLSEGSDLRDDIGCAVSIYKGAQLIEGGTCNTCLDELKDQIQQWERNHECPSPGGKLAKRCTADAIPSATGYYSDGYASMIQTGAGSVPTLFTDYYSDYEVFEQKRNLT